MNISQLTKLVPASFDYKFLDPDGNERTESVNLQLRRLSFASTSTAIMNWNGEGILPTHPVAEVLEQLIVSWDITDENGEMFPISANWFVGPECPAEFVGQLLNCVMDRVIGNPQKAATSQNGSEAEAMSTASVTT